jgi:hypothetical protein
MGQFQMRASGGPAGNTDGTDTEGGTTLPDLLTKRRGTTAVHIATQNRTPTRGLAGQREMLRFLSVPRGG